MQKLEWALSRCLTIVEIQQTTTPFAAMNGVIACTAHGKWLQQSIPFALMMAFGVVMSFVFPERLTKRAFAEKNHAIKALALY